MEWFRLRNEQLEQRSMSSHAAHHFMLELPSKPIDESAGLVREKAMQMHMSSIVHCRPYPQRPEPSR